VLTADNFNSNSKQREVFSYKSRRPSPARHLLKKYSEIIIIQNYSETTE